jgi:hypothetical protein
MASESYNLLSQILDERLRPDVRPDHIERARIQASSPVRTRRGEPLENTGSAADHPSSAPSGAPDEGRVDADGETEGWSRLDIV